MTYKGLTKINKCSMIYKAGSFPNREPAETPKYVINYEVSKVGYGKGWGLIALLCKQHTPK